jgi:alkylated DNA repair protein (DNA oxidative demethylase)
MKQLSLLTDPFPPGFDYRPDFLTPEEEQALLRELPHLPWKNYQYGEFTANRRIAAYGMEDKLAQGHEGQEPPAFILPYLDRVARTFDADPAELVAVLFTHYPVGAAIGWHSDAPMYEKVFGFSLLSDCVMDFQLVTGKQKQLVHLDLEARGAYTMQGPSRWPWQHRIREHRQERYSVTFRSLK